MSSPVELDPSAPGTVVRRAFALEALLNLFTLPLLFYPKSILSHVVDDPATITPITELLAQVFAVLVVGALTPALLLGFPNTRQAIESRRAVYYVLGYGEFALILLLAWHALSGWEKRGLSQWACWGAIVFLIPPVLWRVFVLFFKPDMIGRYREYQRF